jgi:DNA-binding response OmpR family regulator
MDVMIVDDEPLIRGLIALELTDVGMSVTEAASAEGALHDIVDDDLLAAVIVTDVNLGPGMNGVAFAAEIRRRWPDVLLVIVTGNALNLDRLAPDSCEATYLKPFDTGRLATDIRALLSPDARRTAASARTAGQAGQACGDAPREKAACGDLPPITARARRV